MPKRNVISLIVNSTFINVPVLHPDPISSNHCLINSMRNSLPKLFIKIPLSIMKLSFVVMLVLLIGASAKSQSGVNYKYYEGTWSALPDFNSISPVKSGTTSYINLNERRRENNYAFLWQGYITIPTTGTYTFEVLSDDGGKLYIGDYGYNTTALVNNDGLHGNQSGYGSINLNAGVYPISFAYFQNGGDQTWEVFWSSNNAGLNRQKLPASVLTTGTTPTPPPPTSGGAGLSYSYYEGSWSSLPDFNTISPKKTGTANNANLHPRERELNYAFMWRGFITVASAGTYTFETLSDDGSRLYIGDYSYGATPLVNNDGLHGAQSRSGSLYLTAGVHPITMTYFQGTGNQTWLVYWSSNTGISKQVIPDNVLTTSTTQPVVDTPQPPAPPPSPQPEPPAPQPQPETSGSGGLTGIRNFYFSSASGDDNRSASQAQNPNTPWRTLGKLNSIFSTLNAGDAVLFNRGEVFEGSINVTKSGSSNPIIFSSYGNGNKPVLNGTVALSNWDYLGGNLWEASCNSSSPVNLVIYNGALQGMGRYPNLSDNEKGYLILESSVSNRQITDYQLSSSPNWTGAEVVIRKNNWVLDRGLITSHNGNTINYNSPSGHEANPRYGYFIQNSPLTLDQNGEWYFNQGSRRMRIYSTTNPNSISIRASVNDYVVNIENRSNITFDNISFQGGDVHGVKIQSSQNIKVQNCNVNFSGVQGIAGSGSSNVVIESTTFNNTNNDAIELYNTSNTTLKGNHIINTGLIPGMGLSNNQQYEAIFIEGSNNLVEANYIENTGYSAITFAGEGANIKNNFVNRFCLTVEDGGGVYAWGDMDKYNRKITGNIILNGIGAHEGTIYPFSTGASGILIDDRTAYIEITNNSIANCSRNGIYLHNSRDMTVRGNTLFNNRIQLGLVHDLIAPDVPIRSMNVTDNIFVSKEPTQMVLEMGSLTNDIAQFGTMNNNYYARPINESGIISVNYKDIVGKTVFSFYDIAGWANQYGFDRNTQGSPVKIPSYQVRSYNGGNRFINGSFNSNTNGVSCQSAPGRCTVSWANGRLDGGSAQVSFDASSGATNEVGTYVNIGSVQAGRHYLVKFSLIGANAAQNIKSYLLQDNGNYSRLSETRYFELTNSRRDMSSCISPTTNESGVLMALEINGLDIPFWIDNVQVYDVEASPTNLDEYIRMEYNNTGSNTTIGLDGNM
jgi:parallel beta-helix repeat protein